MSLPAIAGLLRRHFLAVLAVLLLAAGVAYAFKHTAPTYTEDATMVFVPPISGAKPNPFEAVGGSLTEAAGTVAVNTMSPQGQRQVLQAGGIAQIDVELLNSYNLQYPNFTEPYLTVATTSQNFPAVHQTFTVVTKLLTQDFVTQQERDGVTPGNRIQLVLAGDTGPLLEQGSSKRALGGLIILTLVAIFGVASFLDRHPIRLFRSSGRRRPQARPAQTRPEQARVPRIRQPGPAAQDY
jgi:hypothetical protein